MSIKRIIIRTNKGSAQYRYYERQSSVSELDPSILWGTSAHHVGKARSLDDAIALAKALTGGQFRSVEIQSE